MTLTRWAKRSLISLAIFLLAVIIIASAVFGAKSYKAIHRAETTLAEWMSHDWTHVSPDIQLSINAMISAEDASFLRQSVSRAQFIYGIITGTSKRSGGLDLTAARLLAFKVVEDERPVDRLYDNVSIETYLIAQPKDRLLEIVLNESFLGIRDDGSEVRGFAQAADFYFHQPLAKITPAQAALLAAMIASPWRFSPLTHADKALDRRNQVLMKMKERAFITAAEADQALREPLLPAASKKN